MQWSSWWARTKGGKIQYFTGSIKAMLKPDARGRAVELWSKVMDKARSTIKLRRIL